MVGPLFPLGRLVATQGALALIKHAGEDLLPALLERHISGDWGDVSPEDVRENKVSVRYGLRVISSYRVAGEGLRVITEADRGTTTFLVPEEYRSVPIDKNKASTRGAGVRSTQPLFTPACKLA